MATALRCYGHRALTNTRGAVFLLSVYLVSLTLLLLGGVSLQRTNMEVRSASLSRDQQQAFWLAEAGLDRALTSVRATPNFATNGEGTEAVGRYTYQIAPRSMQFKTDGPLAEFARPEALQQITATGESAGRTNTITANMLTSQSLGGILARRSVRVGEGPPIEGDIQSAWGKGLAYSNRQIVQRPTVEFSGSRTVEGDITIGPPDLVDGWTTLYGSAFEPHIGIDLFYGRVTVTGHIGQSPAFRPPSASAPIVPCSTDPLIIDTDRDLRDGDPLDRTPAGDGRLVICVPYVHVHGTGGDDNEERVVVTLHDPTLIYTTGAFNVRYDAFRNTYVYYDASDRYLSGYPTFAFATDSFAKVRLGDTIAERDNLHARPDRGLTVVAVPLPNPNRRGDVAGVVEIPGPFEGSIYAPDSDVVLRYGYELAGGFSARARTLGFVVGDNLRIGAVQPELYRRAPTNEEAASQQAPLLSWTN